MAVPQMFNGVLAQVGIFPIKEAIKNQIVKKPGEHFGKQFNVEKSHTIAIKVADLKIDGTPYTKWITIGHKKYQEGRDLIFQVEQDGQWLDVFEGSSVFFFYSVSGGFINIDMKSFKLMVPAPRPDKVYTFGNSSADVGGSGLNPSGSGGYNLKGVKIGHCGTCAAAFFKANGWGFNADGMFDIGCYCNELTTELEKITGDGAAAGHSVKQACEFAKTKEEIKLLSYEFISLAGRFKDALDGKASLPATPQLPTNGNMGVDDPDADIPW